jgi:hypothetical protein
VRRHAGEPEPPPGLAVTAADVRAIIAARWLRRRCLGFDPGEAGWSMMLELYAARLEGVSMSQTRSINDGSNGQYAGKAERNEYAGSKHNLTGRTCLEGIWQGRGDNRQHHCRKKPNPESLIFRHTPPLR